MPRLSIARIASPSQFTRDASLLSPTAYDDDAASVHSERSERSDQDTDSEDDEVLMGARTSAEIRAHDHSVLLEEEERDRLLMLENRRKGRRGSALSIVPRPLKKLFSKSHVNLPRVDNDNGKMHEKGRGRRVRRRQKRQRMNEKVSHGEDGRLMFDMEEGELNGIGSAGSSSEAETSDEIDRQGLSGLRLDIFKRKRWKFYCFMYLLVVVGFLILVLISWRLSFKKNGSRLQSLMSNGTAIFAPTTIIISLDGFRADFLKRGLTPRMSAFIEEGVSPPFMNPSFPSVTFPNHHTLATGLYPESHGIIGNSFWDDAFQERFDYMHAGAMDAKWWGGEPIWVTAEKQGLRTAVHMWPGSEAHVMGIEPTFLDKFRGNEPLANKAMRILELLDKPGPEDEYTDAAEMRPQLIAAYVPNVDARGHLYGPNSTEIRVTITEVDNMLDQMFKGLEQRNLTSVVNVIVVSDHGMATTDMDRMIQLEDLVDVNLFEEIEGWPLYGLRPKVPEQLQNIYEELKAHEGEFEVYLRDGNMPERYHFSKNKRIAPLWIVPKTGWAIVTKEEFDIADARKKGMSYHPRGLHGYDHEHPLMRAIFIARGPAFPHAGNTRLEPFQNVEVYNIICDSLALDPSANNGTLRLPLQTAGTHDQQVSSLIPADPEPLPAISLPSISLPSTSLPYVSLSSTLLPSSQILSILTTSTTSTTSRPQDSLPAVTKSTTPNPAVSAVLVDVSTFSSTPSSQTDTGGLKNDAKNFWNWLTDTLDDWKQWVGDIAAGLGKGGSAAAAAAAAPPTPPSPPPPISA